MITGLRKAGLLLLLAATPRLVPAQTYSLLYSFSGVPDGSDPDSLIRTSAGDMYGTTGSGGVYNQGTVFKLDSSGNETVLYSFTGGSDGGGPVSVIRYGGKFYGTTYRGGDSDLGTIFVLDRKGKETVLHSFSGVPDGASPYTGLVRDPGGNLYGTTSRGGTSNRGMVFKLDPAGNFTILYSFTTGNDGLFPNSLIRDSSGNLYGTTDQGGGQFRQGTVFKLDSAGRETVLYSFSGGTDGGYPTGVIRSGGKFYGTTVSGGDIGLGTVFVLDKKNKETVLHSFSDIDGAFPGFGVIRDSAGNLYGTTEVGGTYEFGVVFKLDKTGKETVLYNFTGGNDGGSPASNLIRDSAGNLYGYVNGGTSGAGAIFELTP